MGERGFTVLPILLAMVMAIASMPTNIFHINAWNRGTERTEPWRAKASQAISASVRSLGSKIRSLIDSAGGPETVATAAVALAVLAIAGPEHAEGSMAIFAVGKLKAFRDRDAELKAELKKTKGEKLEIGDRVAAEKRAMSDEERTALATLSRTQASLESQIEDNAGFLRDAEERNEAERHAPDPAASPDAASTAAAAANGDKKGFKSLLGGISGEFLQAVYRAGIGEGRDKRLIGAAPTGLNETVPSEGGFLVGMDQSSGIIQRVYETGEILKRVFKLPVSAGSNGIKLNMIDETSRADGSRFGGIRGYWVAEGGEKLASKPKFRNASLELKKVAALVYATDELLQDAVALEAWIKKYLPLELSFKVEDAILSGTGAGQPLGILNSGATISVTRTTTGAVVLEDVQAMWARMWAPARKNAVWLVDQSVESSLEVLNIAIGTGGVLAPVYKPAGSTPGQEFATLYGRPIIVTEYSSALGTVGDIILANFDEYTLIDKGGVQEASSIHVRFIYDESVFRFVYRVDGQPNWNSVLTPKNGGATLSPFVVLAT